MIAMIWIVDMDHQQMARLQPGIAYKDKMQYTKVS